MFHCTSVTSFSTYLRISSFSLSDIAGSLVKFLPRACLDRSDLGLVMRRSLDLDGSSSESPLSSSGLFGVGVGCLQNIDIQENTKLIDKYFLTLCYGLPYARLTLNESNSPTSISIDLTQYKLRIVLIFRYKNQNVFAFRFWGYFFVWFKKDR